MDEHPLITWYASLRRLGAASAEGNDVVLGDLGGKRFGVGLAGADPLLCCHEDDAEVIRSVPWTSAAMAFGHKGRDWVALSCKDIRVRDAADMNPVPARLWIPVTVGRLEAWKGSEAKRLRVGIMKAEKKGPPTLAGEPFADIPLKLVGK